MEEISTKVFFCNIFYTVLRQTFSFFQNFGNSIWQNGGSYFDVKNPILSLSVAQQKTLNPKKKMEKIG